MKGVSLTATLTEPEKEWPFSSVSSLNGCSYESSQDRESLAAGEPGLRRRRCLLQLARVSADVRPGSRRRGTVRTMHLDRDGLRSPLAGVVAGVLAVAVVTAAIAVFDNLIPVLSLGVLYVFAVLPIALFWGSAYAVVVAIASMFAFNFFFLAPVHSFTLADRSNWFALLVYVVTAIVVGSLASRARRGRAEAEQRELEAALLADVAVELLRGTRLEDELERIERRTASVLGVSSVRIDLAGRVSEGSGEAPHSLSVDGRRLGDAVHAGARGGCSADSATAPAGAGVAAGGRTRAGAAGARCARGGGASAQ